MANIKKFKVLLYVYILKLYLIMINEFQLLSRIFINLNLLNCIHNIQDLNDVCLKLR